MINFLRFLVLNINYYYYGLLINYNAVFDEMV